MDYNIDSSDLKRVQKKLKDMPGLLDKNMKTAMTDSMLLLWSNVPPYPAPPENSKYRRTGTLGRTLGSGEGGGKASGQPTVYSISGSGINMAGKFGTSLAYAKYVIDATRQAYMHVGRWWTMKTILDNARDKITKVWATMVRVVLNKKL
jgi:hypothetical protein